MTKEELQKVAKNILPFVQDLADGKTIQWLDHAYAKWLDISSMEQLIIYSDSEIFRLKPDPREIKMVFGPDGELRHEMCPFLTPFDIENGYCIKTFVEKIEENNPQK